MTSHPPDRGPAFRRLGAEDLYQALAGATPPLIVDVRRQAAFESLPQRLPDAVPLLLDAEPLRIPDVPRDRPLVAYCLCSGEASSSRVAQWLLQEGYRDVGVLVGGLQAWLDAGHAAVPSDPKRDARGVDLEGLRGSPGRAGLGAAAHARHRVPAAPGRPQLPDGPHAAAASQHGVDVRRHGRLDRPDLQPHAGAGARPDPDLHGGGGRDRRAPLRRRQGFRGRRRLPLLRGTRGGDAGGLPPARAPARASPRGARAAAPAHLARPRARS